MAKEIGKIDLHMHTTVSDGTDTPEGIIDAVKAAGISCFSVTDHDSFKSAGIIPKLVGDDLAFIPGIEFSCRDEEGKYHILGYGFDTEGEAIRKVVEKGHDFRMKKVMERLDFLKTTFGFSFPDEEIKNLLALDNPGKPHIGNMMVKYGFAATKEEAINEYINKVHFKNEYVRPEEAISGILASGGIPILAHPFYGSGGELILGDEMDARLKKLMDFGLQGLEAFYSGFTAKLRDAAIALAEKNGLYVTAGSDYHGANKLVKLGDTGLDETKNYPSGLLRFLEKTVG